VPAAPSGDRWPGLCTSKPASLAVFRSAWADANDLVAVVHHGSLRLLGMGTGQTGTTTQPGNMLGGAFGAGSETLSTLLMLDRLLKGGGGGGGGLTPAIDYGGGAVSFG
jgi:hypothetical protein